MCTAITYQKSNLYFGRTLDYDFSYEEEVTVTPRNYPFRFRFAEELREHYAIIGMAFVPDDFPLYYDAVNEKGLCMAGLNFVGNAHYEEEKAGCVNVAQFELIPYILASCATVKQATERLKKINLTNTPCRADLPPAQLHWLIADKDGAVTVEFVAEGLKIYENPVGVLANNPPFSEQLSNLNDYLYLSPHDPQNTFSEKIALKPYSRGMGAIGLPGDLSSKSRFVRAAFVKLNSLSGDGEEQCVNQFFHILGAVAQPRGACAVGDSYEITVYTSCCNADMGIYYYTTYENHAISAVDMHAEDLDGARLSRYPVGRREAICYRNGGAEKGGLR